MYLEMESFLEQQPNINFPVQDKPCGFTVSESFYNDLINSLKKISNWTIWTKYAVQVVLRKEVIYMISDNDKDFIKGIFIVLILALIVFLIFQSIQERTELIEEIELKKVSSKIAQNYEVLQSKKDMSCFLIVETNLEKKKVSLFLDENMSIATCGEQIVQFTNYALREPFTLEIIE